MKILIVSPVFWPEVFRINDFAFEMIHRGHKVEVLAGLPNYPSGKFFKGYSWDSPLFEEVGGVRILRFPVVPRGKGRSWQLLLHYSSWLAGALFRLSFHWDRDWDAIFVFESSPVTVGLPALFARFLSRAPAVIWVQDLWPEVTGLSPMMSNSLLYHLTGGLSDWIYGAFDQVLTQSHAFLEALGRRGIPRDRISVVFNWAEDLYHQRPERLDTEAAAQPAEFVILFAGNLGRAQALPTLLDAAERLKGEDGLKWIFVGDGAQKAWMEEEVARRGLAHCVKFLGRRPQNEMPFLFAHADVLLVSLGNHPVLEMTIPGKLQSYLAAGRPVLGSISGEAARIIEQSGAGWVAPSEDAPSLARLVLEVKAIAPETRLAHGADGRHYFETNFSRSGCINEIENALANAQGLARTRVRFG